MLYQSEYRVQEVASNQPNASTAYNLPGTAETGMVTFASVLSNGDQLTLLAEEIDANGAPAGAWEIIESVYTDAATDTLSRGTLIKSSSGAKIDWSVVGSAPRLTLIQRAKTDPMSEWERVPSMDVSYDGAATNFDFEDLDTNYDWRFAGSLVGFDGTTSYTPAVVHGTGGATTTWFSGAGNKGGSSKSGVGRGTSQHYSNGTDWCAEMIVSSLASLNDLVTFDMVTALTPTTVNPGGTFGTACHFQNSGTYGGMADFGLLNSSGLQLTAVRIGRRSSAYGITKAGIRVARRKRDGANYPWGFM